MTIDSNSVSMFIFFAAMKQSCQSHSMGSLLQNVYGRIPWIYGTFTKAAHSTNRHSNNLKISCLSAVAICVCFLAALAPRVMDYSDMVNIL